MNKESWSDFEKYLISRIDELSDSFTTHKEDQSEKLQSHEMKSEKKFQKLKFRVYVALILLAGSLEGTKWVIEFLKKGF